MASTRPKRGQAEHDEEGRARFTNGEQVRANYQGKANQPKFPGWIYDASKHPVYRILNADDGLANQPDFSENVHWDLIEKYDNPMAEPMPTELVVIKRDFYAETSDDNEACLLNFAMLFAA